MTVAPARTHPRRTRAPRLWVVLAAIVSVVLLIAVLLVLIRRDANNPASAQVMGSGVAATEARPLPHFSGVALGVGANVTIYPSDRAVAVVRTDDNLVGRITTRVRDGVLVVGGPGRFTTRTPLTVAIGAPQLDALAVTRGGSVRLRNINGKRLAVTVAGLGGSVRGGGAVDRLAVVLRTFGNVQLKALTARDVHAVLGGSGQIVVTATQKVDAILSGSGAIVYYGNPAHVHKTVLGTGSVTAG